MAHCAAKVTASRCDGGGRKRALRKDHEDARDLLVVKTNRAMDDNHTDGKIPHFAKSLVWVEKLLARTATADPQHESRGM